jgi:hypothetical protein
MFNSWQRLIDFNLKLLNLYFLGALTLKNYMFSSRPWELLNVETVDPLDSLGSSIRIDFMK